MTLAEMAQSIVASRREFGEIFLQAQVELNAGGDRERFESYISGNDVQDFEQALTVASNNGWLPILLKLLIDRGRHDGNLIAALQQVDPANQAMQAITNPARGLGKDEVDLRRITAAFQWMAKVIVKDLNGNEFKTGTGVLVYPHLVLTAWHVVASLFDRNAQGGYVFRPGSHKQLLVAFDYRLAGNGAPLAPESVTAHPQWCLAFSTCHQAELTSGLPDDLQQLDGKWDYALIRLAGTPGQQRRWALISEDAVVPIAKSPVLLFHHAAGQPVRWDDGEVAAGDPTLAKVVPDLRFLHSVNALGGASGGPCFDKTYKLFGIHQGVWPPPANGNGAATVNRGIPISHVRESIFTQLHELPVPNPEDSLAWQLESASGAPARPVIACDEIQTLMWRAVSGLPRIILIRGPEGSGKSFRLELLTSLLPQSGHLKVPLRANEELRKPPLELAKTICDVAGAKLRDIEPPADAVSTGAEWVKNELVPAVVDALRAVRDGRLIWLLLRDLNRARAVHDGAADFLLQLCENVATEDWLRFVLDGAPQDVPITVQNLRVVTECPLPQAKDLENYLRRSIAARGHTPPDDQVRLLAGLTITTDFANYRAQPTTALLMLSQRMEQVRQAIEGGL